jgi:hypothetical protein
MTKHRLGTIQSFRPGYDALMPHPNLYGKSPAAFQRGLVRQGHSGDHSRDGTGSRARTYDLRFWRPPLYQLSYARIVRLSTQHALPKSFRARCKERCAPNRPDARAKQREAAAGCRDDLRWAGNCPTGMRGRPPSPARVRENAAHHGRSDEAAAAKPVPTHKSPRI